MSERTRVADGQDAHAVLGFPIDGFTAPRAKRSAGLASKERCQVPEADDGLQVQVTEGQLHRSVRNHASLDASLLAPELRLPVRESELSANIEAGF